jgi:hypothetical protein
VRVVSVSAGSYSLGALSTCRRQVPHLAGVDLEGITLREMMSAGRASLERGRWSSWKGDMGVSLLLELSSGLSVISCLGVLGASHQVQSSQLFSGRLNGPTFTCTPLSGGGTCGWGSLGCDPLVGPSWRGRGCAQSWSWWALGFRKGHEDVLVSVSAGSGMTSPRP